MKVKKRFVNKDLESIAGNKGKAFEKFWVVGVDLAIEASSPTRCTQAYWYFLCCPGFTFVWKKKNNNPISLTSADPLLACWTVQKVEEQGHNTEARWQSHSWDGLAPGKEDQDLEKRNWVFNKYRCQCWDWGWFSKRGQLYVDSWFWNLCNISFLLPPVSLSSLAHVLWLKMDWYIWWWNWIVFMPVNTYQFILTNHTDEVNVLVQLKDWCVVFTSFK